MAKNWIRAKDPDEVVDYDVNWADQLAEGETISTSAWTVPAGITKNSDSISSARTIIWLSGGTAGEVYECVNRIVTSAARTFDQTCKLKCKAR